MGLRSSGLLVPYRLEQPLSPVVGVWPNGPTRGLRAQRSVGAWLVLPWSTRFWNAAWFGESMMAGLAAGRSRVWDWLLLD